MKSSNCLCQGVILEECLLVQHVKGEKLAIVVVVEFSERFPQIVPRRSSAFATSCLANYWKQNRLFKPLVFAGSYENRSDTLLKIGWIP